MGRIRRNDDGVHKAERVDDNQIMEEEHFSQAMQLIQALYRAYQENVEDLIKICHTIS